MTRTSRSQLFAVFSVTLLIMFGFGMIVPTLPRFAERFGVHEAGIGLLLTVFSGTRLFADLFAGRLIDRYGDRLMVGLGAAIVGVSSIAAGAAPNYPALVALRGFGGIGSAFFLGALMSHLVGTVDPAERGRAMGLFQGMMGAGLILGPAVGGVIGAAAGPNTPLYVYGAICLVSAPLTVITVGRARHSSQALSEDSALGAAAVAEAPPPSRAPRASRLRPLLRDSAYRAALMTTATGFLISGSMQTLIPGIWRDITHTEGSAGLPFTVTALAGIIVLWHAGSISDRYGRKVALIPALVASAGGLVALAYAHSVLPLMAIMVLLGLASGYTRPAPTAMVADVATPEARGVAVAGYRTAGDIGSFVGPILVGVIAQYSGVTAAFLVVGAIAAVNVVVAMSARETAPSRVRALLAEQPESARA